MWSLFPKSWFRSSEPNARRSAEAVRHLKEDWLKWLATAIAKVEKNDVVSTGDALKLLPSLDCAKLLQLDQAFRYGTWAYPEGEPGKINLALTPLSGVPGDDAAYLFTAACNSNGFIRERALIAFEHFPDRLAVAAALIRCDDWVPQVQQAAIALLIRLVESDIAYLIFDYLPLLLRLQQRQRVAEETWPNHIEPVLLAPKFREIRWSSAKSANSETRAFAYRLAFRADPDRAEDLLKNALADPQPQIALWALGEVRGVLDAPQAETLFRRTLGHRHSAVRAEALRQYATSSSPELRGELEHALFDASRGPRDTAAYLLGIHFGESAIRYWREKVDSKDARKRHIAVVALAYVATSEDTERLEDFLTDPLPRVRAIVLRGLIRAKAPGIERRLSHALRDSSALVVRYALRLIASEKQLLDRSELEDAYACAGSDAIRLLLVHSARLLNKWESLAFLIPLLAKGQSAAANSELDRWLQSSNRRFSTLRENTRSEILKRLSEAKVRNPALAWTSVEQILAHA